MPRVRNRHRAPMPTDAVYIGRPSKWGNRYGHMAESGVEVLVASRLEAVQRFQEDLLSDPVRLSEVKQELRGQDLWCWCAPAPCHGDVLLAVANDLPLPPLMPRLFGG